MFEKMRNKINHKIKDIEYTNTLSIAAALNNQKAFGDLKCCNEGKSVALCGAGPSLSQYIPIPDTMHIALNRALLRDDIKFDWFIGDDWAGIKFFQEKLLTYDCLKLLGHSVDDYEDQVPESFRIRSGARKYYTDIFLTGNGFDSRFVIDIDAMPIGNMPNIALQAMQIVLFSHPSKIYLVGCDATTGHFTDAGLSEKEVQKINRDTKLCVSAESTVSKWKELKEIAQRVYPDVEIISINPIGLKGLFHDEYQKKEIK